MLVPQGFCVKFDWMRLKLLANQQEDRYGLLQNIVTNLCEVSRKGLTEGLRNFIQVANHRAQQVGHLSEGLGTFQGTKAERIRRISRGDGQGELR